MRYMIIGIKGSGCCAVANILKDLGEEVAGCDSDEEFYTSEKLKEIRVYNFDEVELDYNTLYIIGNAYHHHVLTQKIIRENYQYTYYPEFIESYFKVPKIGVAGSHGKSTCTSFLSKLTDQKINALIGDGTGFGDKEAKYFVMEACEYKRNFLKFNYEYLIILNIDYDHPDFFKNEIEYDKAFLDASRKTKYLITNYDDENCRKIRHKNLITFGFNNNADMVIRSVGSKVSLSYRNEVYFFDLPFSAKGYLYDFAAAFLLSLLICKNVAYLKENYKLIKMPKRRLNFYLDKVKNNVYLDDYAHHPTEIKNVLEEVKNRYPNKKLIVVYQPHTYTRSIAFFDAFKDVFKDYSEVYIAQTFSSVREVSYVDSFDETFGYKAYNLEVEKDLLKRKNVVIAFLGAGDIGNKIAFFINNKKDY